MNLPRNKLGQFVKKKCAERQLKAALHRTLQATEPRAKANNSSNNNVNIEVENPVKGLRVVDVGLLRQTMHCKKCKADLSFRDIQSEKIVGLASILSVRCPSCQKMCSIHTSDRYWSEKSQGFRYVVNTKAAAGCIDSGIGTEQVNTFLSALNMPGISNNTFKRAENEIGPAIEEVAIESCEEALAVERELTLHNPLYVHL